MSRNECAGAANASRGPTEWLEERKRDTSSPFSYQPCDQIKDAAAAEDLRKFQKRAEKGLQLPFDPGEDKLTLMHQIFSPRRLIVADHGFSKVNPHPVMAVATLLCEEWMDNQSTDLEFGQNVRKTLRVCKHTCLKLDGRDEYRIRDAAVNKRGHCVSRNMLSGFVCQDGVENCEKPAKVIMAINATMDLEPKDMFEIFEKHQTDVGYFAMVLPPDVALTQDIEDVRNGIRWTVFKKCDGQKKGPHCWKRHKCGEDSVRPITCPDEICMSFIGDCSSGYVHKVAKLQRWLRIKAMDGGARPFNLVFERFREYGPMCIIKVIRTHKAVKIPLVYSLSYAGHQPVLDITAALPRLSALLNSGTAFNWMADKTGMGLIELLKDCDTFWVPSELHNYIVQHMIARRDNDVQRSQVPLLLTSKMQAITIGTVDIQGAWSMKPEDFSRLAMAIYIQVLMLRQVTGEIGYIIDVIKGKKGGDLLDKINYLWDHSPYDAQFNQRVKFNAHRRMAKLCHKDSREHEIFRTVVKRGYVSKSDYYEFTTTEKKIEHIAWRLEKQFTKEGIEEGYCFDDACRFLGDFDSGLGKYPTRDQCEEFMEQLGFRIENDCVTGTPLVFEAQPDGTEHAVLKTLTNDVCEHTELMCKWRPPAKGGPRLNLTSDRKYILDNGSNKLSNIQKTETMLPADVLEATRGDKYRMVNMSAYPFNDRRVWNMFRREQSGKQRWLVTHGVYDYDKSATIERKIDGHEYVECLNALCMKCVMGLGMQDFVYADVGFHRLSVDFLQYNQAKALYNITMLVLWNMRVCYNRTKACVKLQNFHETVKSGYWLDLYSVLQRGGWKLFDHPNFAAGEVFACLDYDPRTEFSKGHFETGWQSHGIPFVGYNERDTELMALVGRKEDLFEVLLPPVDEECMNHVIPGIDGQFAVRIEPQPPAPVPAVVQQIAVPESEPSAPPLEEVEVEESSSVFDNSKGVVEIVALPVPEKEVKVELKEKPKDAAPVVQPESVEVAGRVDMSKCSLGNCKKVYVPEQLQKPIVSERPVEQQEERGLRPMTEAIVRREVEKHIEEARNESKVQPKTKPGVSASLKWSDVEERDINEFKVSNVVTNNTVVPQGFGIEHGEQLVNVMVSKLYGDGKPELMEWEKKYDRYVSKATPEMVCAFSPLSPYCTGYDLYAFEQPERIEVIAWHDVLNWIALKGFQWVEDRKVNFSTLKRCKCLKELPYHGVALRFAEGVEHERGKEKFNQIMIEGIEYEVPPMEFSEISHKLKVNALFEFEVEAKKLLSTPSQEIYAKLNQECGARIKQLISELKQNDRPDEEEFELKMSVLAATYGGGKTTTLLNLIKERECEEGKTAIAYKTERERRDEEGYDYDRDSFFVITPTNELKKDFLKDRRVDLCRERVLTCVTGFNALFDHFVKYGKIKRLYLDELCTIDTVYLMLYSMMCEEMIGIGDNLQCEAGDGKTPARIETMREIVTKHSPNRSNLSFSTPLDAVAMINARTNGSTVTLSKVVRSLFHVTERSLPPKNCSLRDDPKTKVKGCKDQRCMNLKEHFFGMSYTIKGAGPNGLVTVRSAQGCRQDQVSLLITANSKMTSELHGQYVVGTSRHRKVLWLYGEKAYMHAFMPKGWGCACKNVGASFRTGRVNRMCDKVKFISAEIGQDDEVRLANADVQLEVIKAEGDEIGRMRESFTNAKLKLLGIAEEDQNELIDDVLMPSEYNAELLAKVVQVAEEKRTNVRPVKRPRVQAGGEDIDSVIQNFDHDLDAPHVSHHADPKSEFNMLSDGDRGVVTYIPREAQVSMAMMNIPLIDGEKFFPDEVEEAEEQLEEFHNYVQENSFDTATLVTTVLDKVSQTQSEIYDKRRKLNVRCFRHPIDSNTKRSRALKLKGGVQWSEDADGYVGVRASKNYGAEQDGSPAQTLNTAVERGARSLLQTQGRGPSSTLRVMEYYTALMDLMDMSKVKKFSGTDLSVKIAECIDRITRKKNYPAVGLYGSDYENTSRIKCHQKVQKKCKMDPGTKYGNMTAKVGPDGEIYVKGGQMVSAQPKIANVLVGWLVACVEEMLHEILKPQYRYCSGESDKQFRRSYEETVAKLSKPGAKYTMYSFDIVEQDTQRDSDFEAAVQMLYEKLGFSNFHSNVCVQLYKRWEMKTKEVSVAKRDTPHSGGPPTVSVNSLHAAAVVKIHHKIDGLVVLVNKGDDVAVVAEKVTMIKPCTWLKSSSGPVNSFIGFLFDHKSIYPDLGRVVGRLVSKTETSNSRHEELMLGVKDSILGCLKDEQHRQRALWANALYYGISYGEANTLYGYATTYINPAYSQYPGDMEGQLKMNRKRRSGGDGKSFHNKFAISQNNVATQRRSNYNNIEFEYNHKTAIDFRPPVIHHQWYV